MKTIMLNKNKKLISTVISLIIGLGASGLSHAAATTDQKSGSFKYVVPTGSNVGKCPSPYAPLTIVLENNTNPVGVKNGDANAIWVNIYYIPLDSRPYSGYYMGYGAKNNLKSFPYETQGVITPTGELFYDSTSDTDNSGPIIGSTLVANGTAGAHYYPSRSWTLNGGGAMPSGMTNDPENSGSISGTIPFKSSGSNFSLQKDSGWKEHANYIKVATISNLMNGRMDHHGAIDYVTLPMRSFQRLRIDVMAGVSASKVVGIGGGNQQFATAELVARWDAESVSNTDGTKLTIIDSYLKENFSGYASGGRRFGAGTSMNKGNTINLLPADSITLNMKGTWHDLNFSNSKGGTGFLTGSTITLNPLKTRNSLETDGRPVSSATGNDLTCD